jgi:hypothetical protein
MTFNGQFANGTSELKLPSIPRNRRKINLWRVNFIYIRTKAEK